MGSYSGPTTVSCSFGRPGGVARDAAGALSRVPGREQAERPAQQPGVHALVLPFAAPGDYAPHLRRLGRRLGGTARLERIHVIHFSPPLMLIHQPVQSG